MGDDTWMNLYEDLIDPSMSFPYDSFNVEDLHSVDNGVIEHIFPLLKSPRESWDFLIGHFLGVDHVGHRVGPGHPTMREKLKQMDTVLREVVELMDDDTLLVVIGDHGMDTKGDHGGDGILETSSATWIYSKSHPFYDLPLDRIPRALVPNTTFPGASTSWRSVQQIDLVPSMALLLGLPIPFNNLGTVIPELFMKKENTLQTALRFNALQIKGYLDAYRSSASGGELDGFWNIIQTSYERTSMDKNTVMDTNHSFTRSALEICRTLWAQFSMTLIVLGLITIVSTIPISGFLASDLGQYVTGWDDTIIEYIWRSAIGFIAGGTVGLASGFALAGTFDISVTPMQFAIFGSSFSGSMTLLYNLRPPNSWKIPQKPSASTIILVVQATLLFSNSFVFWEERVVLFFLISSLVPFILPLLRSTNIPLRNRALKFGGVFVILTRFIAISTICREEQGGSCQVTFYASSVIPAPPWIVRSLIIPAAFLLPKVVRRFMRIAAADHGLAPFTVEIYFRAALIGGTAFWLLDWIESYREFILAITGISISDSDTIRTVRTIIATTIAWSTGVGLALWSASPLNLKIRKTINTPGDPTIQVFGFANSFGSFYLSFLLFIFTTVWLGSQLSAQIALALSLVAFLAYLEFVDTVRDIISAPRQRVYQSPTFTELMPLALLGLEVFYATGHEATLSSLQWKSAFIFTADRGITSPFTVALNTIGPTVFFALATPLLALWAVEPFDKTSRLLTRRGQVTAGALKSILLTGTYHAVILAASAACAMILRRHLMVWKVFAPRFMLAALCSVAVDIAGILAMLGGVSTVVDRVSSTYQGVPE